MATQHEHVESNREACCSRFSEASEKGHLECTIDIMEKQAQLRGEGGDILNVLTLTKSTNDKYKNNIEKFLECAKVDLNQTDSDGLTALDIANRHALDINKLYLKNGASICHNRAKNATSEGAFGEWQITKPHQPPKFGHADRLEIYLAKSRSNNGKQEIEFASLANQEETGPPYFMMEEIPIESQKTKAPTSSEANVEEAEYDIISTLRTLQISRDLPEFAFPFHPKTSHAIYIKMNIHTLEGTMRPKIILSILLNEGIIPYRDLQDIKYISVGDSFLSRALLVTFAKLDEAKFQKLIEVLLKNNQDDLARRLKGSQPFSQPAHWNIIRQKRETLLNNLTVDDSLIDKLLTNDIIDEDVKTSIAYKLNPSEKIRILLNCLRRSTEETFIEFVRILRETDHVSLSEDLRLENQ